MYFRKLAGLASLGLALTVVNFAIAADPPKTFRQPVRPVTRPAAAAASTNVATSPETATPVVAGTNQKGPATIKISVPTNAKIWIGEQLTTQSGKDRTFISPPLDPGKNYAYKIKVAWPTASKEDFSVEHEITVKANQTSAIDFTELAAQAPVQQASVRPMPTTTVQPVPANVGQPPRRGLFPRLPASQRR